jgi:hypothetical protein
MGLLSVLYTASAVALSFAGLANAARYCDAATNVCYSETRNNDIAVRVALPVVETAPFEILLQIVAPKATAGWVGIAWGGKSK